MLSSEEETLHQDLEEVETNRGNASRPDRRGRNAFASKTQKISFNTRGLSQNNRERAEKLKKEQEELEMKIQ